MEEAQPTPDAQRSQTVLYVHTYIRADAKGEDYCAAYVVETEQGFKATVVTEPAFMPRGKAQPPPYHYTHNTLQEAKDWCVVELVKRRLDT